jgi:hypothetical protein
MDGNWAVLTDRFSSRVSAWWALIAFLHSIEIHHESGVEWRKLWSYDIGSVRQKLLRL